MKAGFFKITQFPNAGIIDGTQILFQGTSTDDKHLYVCRKGIDAINVQAIVDHDLMFVYIFNNFLCVANYQKAANVTVQVYT